MQHDNWNPEDNLVFSRDDILLIKRDLPTKDGLYFIYLEKEIKQASNTCIGLMYLQNNEWLSYPGKYALNTLHINNNFIACIGPIPESL